MSDTTVRRSFRFSTGTLIRVAQRLSGALNDPTFGPPLVDYLSVASAADFTAQLALVAKLADEQSGAFGAVSALTLSQQKALRALHRQARATRRKAKFVFTGQHTVLRSEFQVGLPTSQSLAAMLDRGRKTLAAARKYADQLTARGWPATATERLQQAVENLTEIDRTHELTKDEKEGLTAQFVTAANLLYEHCITVQDAARIVYPKDENPAQPATVEARGRFLLGEFPPRAGAPAVVTPTEPTDAKGPLTPVPVDPVVGVARPEEVLKAA
jgi:hypothetical protein